MQMWHRRHHHQATSSCSSLVTEWHHTNHLGAYLLWLLSMQSRACLLWESSSQSDANLAIFAPIWWRHACKSRGSPFRSTGSCTGLHLLLSQCLHSPTIIPVQVHPAEYCCFFQPLPGFFIVHGHSSRTIRSDLWNLLAISVISIGKEASLKCQIFHRHLRRKCIHLRRDLLLDLLFRLGKLHSCLRHLYVKCHGKLCKSIPSLGNLLLSQDTFNRHHAKRLQWRTQNLSSQHLVSTWRTPEHFSAAPHIHGHWRVSFQLVHLHYAPTKIRLATVWLSCPHLV